MSAIGTETNFILEELNRLEVLHQRRSLKRLEASENHRICYEGQELINFSSNDYLGLSQDPRVKQAAKEGIDRCHASTASSRLICGNFDLHEQLEEELARFKERESALVFSSGYLTNIGILSALVGQRDEIYSDSLNHASIIDGCRLSKGKTKVYRHADLNHLEDLLKSSSAKGRKLVVTDSVFSMDGDLADLPGLVTLAARYHCLLILDEAHATGVLGNGGRGLVEYFVERGEIADYKETVDIEMGTLSKALGSFGGFVACSRSMRDFLINKCRSFIFSTALPPSAVGAARASLRIIQQDSSLREKLRCNARLLYSRLGQIGCSPQNSLQTPIVPVVFGAESKTLQISEGLMRNGFYVPAIRPPSVPQGSSRLRITVSAAHSESEIGSLVEALARVKGQEE